MCALKETSIIIQMHQPWNTSRQSLLILVQRQYGRLAQLVEQLTLNQRVVGSSPTAPTISLINLGNLMRMTKFLRVFFSHPLFFFISLSVFCFLWLDRPFAAPDEARYIEIPREMVETGDWLTPRLNGVRYFEKPPLMYWIHATLISFFGTTEWIMRLVPAFFGWLGAISTYLFAQKIFGVGRWAAWILVTSALYVSLSRLIILDMPLTTCITVGLICFYQAIVTRKRIWFYSMTTAFAAGVMIKGLIAVALPGLVIVVWMCIERIPLRPFYPFSNGLLFLILVAPWHIMMHLKHPDFLHQYFVVEHFLRYTTTLHKRYQPFWFFIPVFIIGMLPWTFSSLRSFRFQGPSRFLCVWILCFFAFFSFSNSKLIPYLLPVFTPMAILTAVRLKHSLKTKVVLTTLGVMISVCFHLFAEDIQKTSMKPFAEIIKKKRKKGEKVACFQGYFQDLPLHLKERVIVIDYMGELEFGARSQEDAKAWFVPSCSTLHKVWIVTRKDRWKASKEEGKIITECTEKCIDPTMVLEGDDKETYLLIYKE